MSVGRFFFKRIILTYLSLAMTLTVYHTLHINWKFTKKRSEFHQKIISGEFVSPYQYRVLAPFLAEVGVQFGESVLSLSPAFIEKRLEFSPSEAEALVRETAYSGLRFIATWLTLIFFHKYMRTWFNSEIAFAGTLLLVALHLYTFRGYFYQPSSFLGILLLTIGVYLITQGATGQLYPLIFFASLSRETCGLLVAFYLAQNWPQKGSFKHAVGLFLVWSAAQLLVRILFGLAPSAKLRPFYMQLQQTVIAWPIFLFGLLWFIPFLRYGQLPTFLQRSLFLVVPPLVAVNFLFGKIEESRLFLDLALVLIPATFFFLFDDSGLAPGKNIDCKAELSRGETDRLQEE